MRLAEALIERKALKGKVKNLEERLDRVAKVQEGDRPTEDPTALLQQLREALEAGARHGITAIPGVEINTDVPGAEVHLLGYFLDHTDAAPNETLLRLLHPIMPFVTEAIWERLPRAAGDPELLIVADWPTVAPTAARLARVSA